MEETLKSGRRRSVTKDFDRLSILCEVNPLGTDTPITFSVNCIFFIDERPIDSCLLVLDSSKERRSLEYPFHRKLYVLALEERFHAKGSLRLSHDENNRRVLTLDVAFWYGRDFDEPMQSVKNCVLISVSNYADEQTDNTPEGADDAN